MLLQNLLRRKFLFQLIIGLVLSIAVISRGILLWTDPAYNWNQLGISYFILRLLPEVLFAFFIGLSANIIESLLSDMIDPRPPFNTYLKAVTQKLHIFGFTLNDFHQETRFKEKLIEKFNQSGEKEFHILLLDPFSDAFFKRSEFEGKDVNILRFECAKSVTRIKEIKNSIKADENRKFDFHFYNIFPTHSMIITDELVWVGPFLYQTTGTKSRWFQIKDITAINEYNNEFENYWENSKNEDVYLQTELQDKIKKYTDLLLIQKNIPDIVNELLTIQKKCFKFKISEEIFNDLREIANYIEQDSDHKKPNTKNVGDTFTIFYQWGQQKFDISFRRIPETICCAIP